MTRLIEFLIALALVLALFLVIGLVLPSKRHLEESAETNRRMTIVFDTLNNVRRLKDWNPLIPHAANELSYSGGDADHSGVGARVDYTSTKLKLGQSEVSWVISEPRQLGARPDLKKPTALRGAVGVWDCESSDRKKRPPKRTNPVLVWLLVSSHSFQRPLSTPEKATFPNA
jgi:hypothetical protein